MKYWEIFNNDKGGVVEDFEAMSDAADRNIKAAKCQKQQARILKTKTSLTSQQKRLSDINREGV
ncbi:MAG: hypothetical protein WCO00_06740 [Rhodospirillaceae bacterium]